MYRVVETEEFSSWLDEQNLKTQAQVQARIHRLMEHEYFGVAKRIDDHLAELKWKNGLRVYFTVTIDAQGRMIILLLGGNKNSQRGDIARAKYLIRKFSEDKR